jgi:hypothetical protein
VTTGIDAAEFQAHTRPVLTTGFTMSEATAQMFDPADPDRPVKAFLQEYQTLFGFGPDEREAKLEGYDVEAVLNFAQHVIFNAARLWTEFSSDQK